MTTDVIDVSLHTPTFPATYNGPGTLIGNPKQSAGLETDVMGYFTSDGNAVQLPVGFQPLHIVVLNETDGIEWDWRRGMAATHTKKTTFSGPTIAIDTTSAITVTDGGAGNFTVNFTAALAGTSKNIIYEIDG